MTDEQETMLGRLARAAMLWARLDRSDSVHHLRETMATLRETADAFQEWAHDLVPAIAPESIWKVAHEPFSRVAALMTLMEMPTREWFLGAGGEPLLRRREGRLVATVYCESLATLHDEEEIP